MHFGGVAPTHVKGWAGCHVWGLLALLSSIHFELSVKCFPFTFPDSLETFLLSCLLTVLLSSFNLPCLPYDYCTDVLADEASELKQQLQELRATLATVHHRGGGRRWWWWVVSKAERGLRCALYLSLDVSFRELKRQTEPSLPPHSIIVPSLIHPRIVLRVSRVGYGDITA